MKELGEMGIKLQSAVKIQRLAVETSDLSRCDTEKVREEAFKLRTTRKRQSKGGREKKVETQAVETLDVEAVLDADAEAADAPEEKADAEVVERCARRAPPVNSDVLPLPWKGRLGYACLNTYLRAANTPVFSSRTCRIASIIEHRHPLQDPTQPVHSTKNRPDKTQPPDVQRGMQFVQELGLANARDIVKMLRWNEKYGIRFMRLSSEMFPFASHEEYGYKLAPFAADVLAEAGRVAGELGHRLTTHPGQYTQIASPRREVVDAAFRDLEYHHEMLSLLKLPEQSDRDAVMILHMGGVYGDKAATLDRFRQNYARLSDGVKRRLVLENDDVSWSVHELLPICEELNIPLVLDYHHHNIVFDASIREGTLDIMGLYDRIAKTWTRKNIKQKMHYSEPVAAAVTPRDRRKHSARVKTLPPCAPDMDLMIEAKDKEQAVFELMRTFKLPGWDLFNDIVPYERDDEPKKETKRAKKAEKNIPPDEDGGTFSSHLALCAPLSLIITMSATDFDSKTKAFLQWFKALPGSTFHEHIEIADFRQRNAGRGIVALQDIPAETALFTVPRSGILSSETSELKEKLPDMFLGQDTAMEVDGKPQQDPWSTLIIVMMYEYFKGRESKWKPYIDVLPASFETPMFWSDAELDELQASATRSKVGKESAEKMFHDKILPVVRANHHLFPTSQTYSDDDLIKLAHRMGSTIMSYAFDFQNEDDEDENESEEWVEEREAKSTMGMVPMADILNADAEYNAHVNYGDDALTVTALRTIKAGEEIFNYYGPHPNSELLRRYGYVTPKHSRYDVVELPWNLVEESVAASLGLSSEQLDNARAYLDSDELEDTFVLERETEEPNPDGTLTGSARFSEIPEDLQDQLKSLLKAVRKAVPSSIADKRKRDEIQHAILIRALDALASQYPTSISEDEQMLSDSGISERRRAAITVRLGEKRLIQEAKTYLLGLASDAAGTDESSAPSKKLRRSD
ncbi:UV-endonuclease UvdE [Trichoderma longibrachiatum ATCC 18648]|uniref:UV-endonuclease UvdE n=1 Tax=Trichoderma longibrachiatum ATCC 18648 TaxID=983965 RepID=A0A2T4CAV7_TRILO|nr:UV-endonuclease UvdE [Trichoderma longibrachiatum ATCC 18648]